MRWKVNKAEKAHSDGKICKGEDSHQWGKNNNYEKTEKVKNKAKPKSSASVVLLFGVSQEERQKTIHIF